MEHTLLGTLKASSGESWDCFVNTFMANYVNYIEPFSADSKETLPALVAILVSLLLYTSRSTTARTIKAHADFTITLDLISLSYLCSAYMNDVMH